MFLGDFHLHSTFSDGKLSIPQLVDLYGRAGFGVIAITDHLCEEKSTIGRAARLIGHTLTRDSFKIYQKILESEANRAWRDYGMLVLTGFELSKNNASNHRSAHILGIGIQDYIAADGDVEDLAFAIQEQGGLAIAAHPVSTRKWEKQTYQLWNDREKLAKTFDAWEVASGRHLFGEVLQSGLPMIANSDLHHPKQMTSWKTLFHCELDPAAIFAAIRQQNIQFAYYGVNHEPMADIRTHGLASRRHGIAGFQHPFAAASEAKSASTYK